jgi:hypothetical protein
MCKYSQKILRDKFGSNILDFKNDVDQRMFAFTIQLEKESNENFNENIKEDRILNHYNNIKTISCRASIIIEFNKNENSNISPCIMLEIRNSTFRQIFDEYIWKFE